MHRLVLSLVFGLTLIMTDEIRAQIVSPQVHEDGSVTFRLRAPNAEEVVVQGIDGHSEIEMTKGSNGIWQGQSNPLPAELYSYSFRVDGTMMIDPSNRFVKKWLTCGSLVEVPGEPARLHEQTDVPHGTVHRHFYQSNATNEQRGVFVYKPPGYSSETAGGYPTIVLMHGYGDDESAWLEVGRANLVADNLIAQGKIAAPIIIMPYGHPLPIELRRDFDDYATQNITLMEQDLVNDLLPFVSQHYALTDDRNQRAIVGLSMGGGQSLTIGLQNLEMFAIVGGFSSAAPQGTADELAEQFSGLSVDASAANSQIQSLWIGCGEDDFLLERNHRFVAWLKEAGIDHTYHESDGGHDWIVWRKYLAEFLIVACGDANESP